jgi:hypothetical protein
MIEASVCALGLALWQEQRTWRHGRRISSTACYMLEAWSMLRCLERGAGMSEGIAVGRRWEGRLVLSCACCCYVPVYQAVCLSIGLCTSLLLHLRVRCSGLSLVCSCGEWRVGVACFK